MWRRPAETLRRRVRWLAPVALLALVPKCLLCVAAYAGLGAALGLTGRELCGASAGPSGGWAVWLMIPCGIAGLVAFLPGRWWHRS